MDLKQLAIDALNVAIEAGEAQLDKLRAERDKLVAQEGGSAHTADDGGHVTPPTGPKGNTP